MKFPKLSNIKLNIALPSILVIGGLAFSYTQIKSTPHETYKYQGYVVSAPKDGEYLIAKKTGITIPKHNPKDTTKAFIVKDERIKCSYNFDVGREFYVKSVYVDGKYVRNLCVFKI